MKDPPAYARNRCSDFNLASTLAGATVSRRELRSIRNQLGHDAVEVSVVNNGSKDDGLDSPTFQNSLGDESTHHH
jgi:hypothetical protein